MEKRSGIPLFVVLALLLPLRQASAQAVQSVEWRLQVKAASALVRASPYADGAVLLTLAKGTMLPSFEKTGEWFRVVVETGEGGLTVVGYVAASDVEVMKAVVRAVGDFWTEESGEFRGLGLSVKLSGGAGFLNGGDFARASRGMFLAWADAILAQDVEPYERVENFKLKGLELEGELLYRLTPRLSLGLGSGFLDATGRGALNYFVGGGASVRLEVKPIITIVPLRLGLTFALPIHRLFNVYAEAGPALYWAKLSHQMMISLWNYGQAATGRALGIHGGCGLELVLTSRGCWFVEIQGRYARFNGFSGRKTSVIYNQFATPETRHTDGDLYFFKHERYSRIDILKNPPPESSGGRRLVYDLKSLGLQTGIRVKF